MSAKTCCICGKSAYPIERTNAGGKDYHIACFKCKTCGLKLNNSNFYYDQPSESVYCKNHVPKKTFTQVTDSVAMKAALNAPKKECENLGTVQKGAGGKPHDVVFGAGAEGASPRQGEQAPAEEVQEEQQE
ncbi:hypothetical protein EIN_274240 [Entamoeba invadens IP1]|uniref:LIM zinc-binding domain-containing protein n=1 Tax=Entamoeba invadens IP1 TaxID=370355 RepID=A0A0A1U1G9_ENTIV|nr:hypothetical protein EIN_274240 [Entamoeba invadens IP1]ELP87857.1 hypothetical protein EIN_274240 [Entamoeba invadens IP1]|eukprot:XP_004254628.1 hypothetical protein EIN_274240 [Entamoeba invadens IP1]